MGRHARGAIIAVAIAGGLLGARADAQAVAECYGFARDRTGNIREGICVGSRRDQVFGLPDQIARSCESLIVCGGPGDLGDCHLTRNVCKGVAAPACNASGFDAL